MQVCIKYMMCIIARLYNLIFILTVYGINNQEYYFTKIRKIKNFEEQKKNENKF